MTLARRLARVTRTEWAILVRAGYLVAIVRLLLVSSGWSSALRRIHGLSSGPGTIPGLRDVSVERLAWAVRTVSRVVPGATCLTQALALQALMTVAGRSGRVQIGVTQNGQHSFESHAWVEHEGRTLLSTPGEVARYTCLFALDVPSVPAPAKCR